MLRTCVVWKHLNTSRSYQVKFYKWITIMHKMQIEIYTNLEAYVCLSCDAMTTKQFFRWKNIFFVNIFGKPVSKCVASFRLRCLPARKRRKVNLNLGHLQWFCLLFSTNKCTAVGISSRAAFYFVCLCMSRRRFPRNFVKDATCSLVLIRFSPNKISCLRSNFSIAYFKNTGFGPFLS